MRVPPKASQPRCRMQTLGPRTLAVLCLALVLRTLPPRLASMRTRSTETWHTHHAIMAEVAQSHETSYPPPGRGTLPKATSLNTPTNPSGPPPTTRTNGLPRSFTPTTSIIPTNQPTSPLPPTTTITPRTPPATTLLTTSPTSPLTSTPNNRQRRPTSNTTNPPPQQPQQPLQPQQNHFFSGTPGCYAGRFLPPRRASLPP